jgi:hypothetical protein
MHVFSSRRRGAGTATGQFNLQAQRKFAQCRTQCRLRHGGRVGRGLDLRNQGGESPGPLGIITAAQQVKLHIPQQRQPGPGRAPRRRLQWGEWRRAILQGEQRRGGRGDG